MAGPPTSRALGSCPVHRHAGYAHIATYHPPFLYEALCNLALAGLLILYERRHDARPGRLFALNLKTREKTLFTREPAGNLGGVERDEKFYFLVTDRVAGTVLRVSPKGEVAVLMTGFGGPADPAYLADKRLLVLPRTRENCVTAYDLTKLKR